MFTELGTLANLLFLVCWGHLRLPQSGSREKFDYSEVEQTRHGLDIHTPDPLRCIFNYICEAFCNLSPQSTAPSPNFSILRLRILRFNPNPRDLCFSGLGFSTLHSRRQAPKTSGRVRQTQYPKTLHPPNPVNDYYRWPCSIP